MREKISIRKRLQVVCLILCLVLCMIPAKSYAADTEYAVLKGISVDGGAVQSVRAIDLEYENNLYVSIRDMAVLLQGTGKAFDVTVSKTSIELTKGGAYEKVGNEGKVWKNSAYEQPFKYTLKRNDFTVNGQAVKYYTMLSDKSEGYYDAFIMLADLAMILDMQMNTVDGVVHINTTEQFYILPSTLLADGYFQGVNSVLVTDITTGERIFGYQSGDVYAIASTTKLMNYTIVMDAVTSGAIGLDDVVTYSDKVQTLAESSDGVLKLVAGESTTVRELIYGMLLPSSNEAALALAEYVAGSEEAFVERMNRKALELGMLSATYYNCHGLPLFTDNTVTAKKQNRMSADDMNTLVSYILAVYPQILEVTSTREYTLQDLNKKITNSNPLLFNMEGVTGLKTGTTNKAGCCLVTSLIVNDGSMDHDIVVILFGAESAPDRGRVSEVLARYASAYVRGLTSDSENTAGSVSELPTNANGIMNYILRKTLR